LAGGHGLDENKDASVEAILMILRRCVLALALLCLPATARAVNVLEAMVRAGLGSSNLAAAGYAEYDPVASNSSTAGKQKNRRIEIALEPYLTAPPK